MKEGYEADENKVKERKKRRKRERNRRGFW